MSTGIYCPATRAKCDRPCMGSECQRVKSWGQYDPNRPAEQPRPPDPDKPPIITAAQCRAARAYLGLTHKQLSKVADVGAKTISRFENGKQKKGVADATLRKLIGAFYDAGVEIIGTTATGRGIRDFKPVYITMGRAGK